MAFQTGHFGVILSGKDQLSTKLVRVGGNFTKMGGDATKAKTLVVAAMKQIAIGAGIAVVGVIGLKKSFEIANVAGNFEEGLARVGAISQATVGELKSLEEAAIQAGVATQFSPEEAVQGLQNLAAMGFNAEKSIQVLLPTLDLAAGGMIGVAEATSTMTSALNIFGIGAEDAGITADRLLRITQLTALQANDLQLALANVSKGAVATKQSLGEMLVVMGLVKNAGLDVSVTSTATSQALIRMAVGADKFAAIGVQIEDAQGKFRPFADVVLDTQKAIAGLGGDVAQAAKITELFGIRGQAAFVNVARAIETGVTDSSGNLLKGAAAVEFMRNQIEDAEGTAQEFRDIMNATFNGLKRLIVGTVATIKTVVGQNFLPVFKVIIFAVNEVFKFILAGIMLIPKPIGVAAAAFIVLASAALVVSGIFIAFKGIAALAVIPALAAMGNAAIVAAVKMWAAFWPILLVLGLIAAAIGVVFWLLGKKTPTRATPQARLKEAVPGSLGAPVRARPAIPPATRPVVAAQGPVGAAIAGATEEAGRRAQDQRRALMRPEAPRKLELTTKVMMDTREVARGVDELWFDETRRRRAPRHTSTGRGG